MRRLAVLLLTGAATAGAQPRPHPLFTDGAVLQRNAPVPVWGTARPGERVTVSVAGRSASAVTGADGWWRVRLAPMAAGGPYVLTIAGARDTVRRRDVLVGEVWVAGGQSNMGFTLERATGADTVIPQSGDALLRLFTVRRDTSDTLRHTLVEPRQGGWSRAAPSTVPSMSAVAYFFARELRRTLGVPVGVIHASWGGTPAEAWTTRATMARVPALRARVAQLDAERRDPSLRKGPAPKNPQGAALMFNAMIAPLAPYAMRGVIWYQGEANAARAEQYRVLFPALIGDWRAAWGQGDFPFLFAQLPGYLPDSVETTRARWAALRDAQALAARVVPNAYMAVTLDQGDPHNLHPPTKHVVGARLALQARAHVYGQPVEADGPRLASTGSRGDTLVLAFTHARGLALRADSGFDVRAGDGPWMPARAVVRGGRVLVWSLGVRAPTDARYAWADAPPVTLWNAAGLPAAPFRTDSLK